MNRRKCFARISARRELRSFVGKHTAERNSSSQESAHIGRAGNMPEGFRLIKNSDAAIIVLHEIYGINPFMHAVCQKYHLLGYDAYCPNLLGISEYFPYDRQDIAYAHFIKHGGFARSSLVTDLCKNIGREYKQIFLLGFSIGATLAWISSASGMFDGAVCHYGSRIRDHLQLTPSCSVMLLFADEEASFSPQSILPSLSAIPNVRSEIFNARHGFCDPFSPNYDATAAMKAEKLAQNFLLEKSGTIKNPQSNMNKNIPTLKTDYHPL